MVSKRKKTANRQLLYALLTLFIGLIIGIFLGMKYEQVHTQSKMISNVPTPTPSPSSVSADERRESIKKCGDIPTEKLSYVNNMRGRTTDTLWSPDCRYIGYTMQFYGLYTPITPEEEKMSGIYLYTVKTGEVKKIDLPDGYNSNVEFIRWEDNDLMVFSFLGAPQRETATYSLSFHRPVSDANRF